MGLTGSFVNVAGRLAGVQQVVAVLAGRAHGPARPRRRGPVGGAEAARGARLRAASWGSCAASSTGGGAGRLYPHGPRARPPPVRPLLDRLPRRRRRRAASPRASSSRSPSASAPCPALLLVGAAGAALGARARGLLTGRAACSWRCSASSSCCAARGCCRRDGPCRAAALRCDHCLARVPGARGGPRGRSAARSGSSAAAAAAGVYRLIQEEGLGAYYETRRWDGPGTPRRPTAPPAARSAFRGRGPRRRGRPRRGRALRRRHPLRLLRLAERAAPARTPGVLAARVNYATHRARVRFDPARTGPRGACSGASARPATSRSPGPRRSRHAARRARDEGPARAARHRRVPLLAAHDLPGGALRRVLPGHRRGDAPAARVDLARPHAPGVLLLGRARSSGDTARPPARSLRHGRARRARRRARRSSTASGRCSRGGEVYFDTAAMIVTLVLVGRYVEAAAKGRASEAVARLARLAPRGGAPARARRRTGAEERRAVPVAELARRRPRGGRARRAGAARRPGAEGRREVDESLVTGESRPVREGAGLAGHRRHGEPARRARRGGDPHRRGHRARRRSSARSRRRRRAKPRIQAVADRVVGVFVPAMLVLAVRRRPATWLAAARRPARRS